MIDGITVLNTVEGTVTFATFLGIFVGLALIVVAVALFRKEGVKCSGVWIALGLGVLFIIVAVVSSVPAAPTYEVLIDESVSFLDFYERYHIVAQRGDIFTIVVK